MGRLLNKTGLLPVSRPVEQILVFLSSVFKSYQKSDVTKKAKFWKLKKKGRKKFANGCTEWEHKNKHGKKLPKGC